MNLEEARETLGVSEGTPQDEVKKKYRSLAKKYHPDINKEANADGKFKKINEAYQCVKDGKGSDPVPSGFPGPSDFGFGFGGQPRRVVIEHIQINVSVSFKDSAWGSKKEIKFNRIIQCDKCNGVGEIPLNNGCSQCGGKGTINSVVNTMHGQMIMSQTCGKCKGRVNVEQCNNCNGKGNLRSETSLQVSIPPGIKDQNILRVPGMGNYIGNMLGMNQYSDVHVIVGVVSQEGFSIEGRDVITHLKIPLIDALKGSKKLIQTLIGSKEVNVLPKSRHNDEIVIPNMGVAKVGQQRIILDVIYPDNLEDMIEFLSKGE